MDAGTLAVAGSWVPVMVGFRRRLEGWRLALWSFVLFAATEDLVLRLVSWNDRPTGVLTWFAYPLAVALGARALFAFPTMAPFRWYCWPLIWLFLATWIVAPAFGDGPEPYSVFVAPLHALVLAGLGVLVWFRATGPDRVLDRQPVLSAAGMVLTYGPFLAVWPASVYLAVEAPQWVLPMWEARAGLLLVGSLLFAAALW